jgi:hypothetical protein
MSSAQGENEEKGPNGGRAVWERPVLQRLAAHEAQSAIHNPPVQDTLKFQGS